MARNLHPSGAFKPKRLQLDVNGELISAFEYDYRSTMIEQSARLLPNKTFQLFGRECMSFLGDQLREGARNYEILKIRWGMLIDTCVKTAFELFNDATTTQFGEKERETFIELVQRPSFRPHLRDLDRKAFREDCDTAFILYPELTPFRDTLEMEEGKIFSTHQLEIVHQSLGFTACRLHEAQDQAQRLPTVAVPDFVPESWNV